MTVEAAIERLYTAFADVPRPRRIDYCTHCWTEAQTRPLLAPTPLREFSAETLTAYATHVLSTVGAVEDFRYFLPRLFEIAFTTGFGWPDLEGLVHRLNRTDWREWPRSEREAMTGLWHAVWTATLTSHPSDLELDAVLCAIGGVDDLTGYLAEWTGALGTPAGAAHLAEYLQFGVHRGKLTNAYWREAEDGAAAVLAWLDQAR